MGGREFFFFFLYFFCLKIVETLEDVAVVQLPAKTKSRNTASERQRKVL